MLLMSKTDENRFHEITKEWLDDLIIRSRDIVQFWIF